MSKFLHCKKNSLYGFWVLVHLEKLAPNIFKEIAINAIMSFPKNQHIQHFHLLKVMFTFFKSRPHDYVVFAIISFPTNQHFYHFPLLNLPLQFFQNVSTFRYSYLFQEIRILLLSYPFQQFGVAWVTTWIKIWCRTCVSVSFF